MLQSSLKLSLDNEISSIVGFAANSLWKAKIVELFFFIDDFVPFPKNCVLHLQIDFICE
jgi:hypothetical protein